MLKTSHRVQRVQREIHEVISTYLMRKQSGLNESLICLNRVEVSSDLRQAKAFVCVIGKQEVRTKTLQDLQSHAPSIQKLFHSRFRMKFCPRLRFYNDSSLKRTVEIDRIMDQMQEDHPGNP